MLLIDGIKYEEWTPQKEVEEFHPLVKEHYKEIFGVNAIPVEGTGLKSEAGRSSVPDWFVITFGNPPQLHIVEIELSFHQLYDHIVNQVGRFINGIKNTVTQKKVVEAMYQEIAKNKQRKVELEEAINSTEVYKFLSDLVSKSPPLTIIIEKRTRELDEAIDLLKYSPIEIVEFQTFVREGVGLAVHAHLFKPLYEPVVAPIAQAKKLVEGYDREGGKRKIARKVTFGELISAGLLKDGQVLYFYNTRPFVDERAQVIASSNQLKYEGDGRTYSKSKLAKILFIKHGFKEQEVQGPKYWKTEAGKFLRDLEEQVRSRRGDRR